MSAGDHLQSLLVHLGSSLHDIDAVLQHGDGAWVVLFSEGAAVEVRMADDSSGLATFGIALGRPPQDEPLPCLEAALRFNAQWRDHQGLRLSMVDGEQPLQLSIDLPARLLDEHSIVQLVEALRARSAGWAAWLLGLPADATAPPAPDLPAFALRV